LPPSKSRKRPSEEKPRKSDPDRTRQDILAVARREFAEHGLSGGRVDAIAAQMRTTKRMIYYYFGSKEGLYQAVLEQVYGNIRTIEQELDLDSLEPADAIKRMITFTFDYEEAHPDFIRLVSIENIHNGAYVARSKKIRGQNATVIATLGRVLARGRRSGVFRADITATDLHMLISAFCFFRISNRHTFGTLFGCDLMARGVRTKHKRLITDAILRMLEPRTTNRYQGIGDHRNENQAPPTPSWPSSGSTRGLTRPFRPASPLQKVHGPPMGRRAK
jgi:AcrR family transcriptional regulator